MPGEIVELFKQLQGTLEVSLEELSLIFRLNQEDLNSIENGSLPLDFVNFRRRVFHLKELVDFLHRTGQSEPISELFKVPDQELNNQSALEVLISASPEDSFYVVSGFFYRKFK